MGVGKASLVAYRPQDLPYPPSTFPAHHHWAVTPAEAFGAALRRHRVAGALTQEDLAFESGVDRTFIARIESGKRQATITTLLHLTRALGVPAADVVAEVERDAAE